MMQHISPASLEDLPSRISYLSAFLDLTPSDGEALLAAKPLVAPLIPTILDEYAVPWAASLKVVQDGMLVLRSWLRSMPI